MRVKVTWEEYVYYMLTTYQQLDSASKQSMMKEMLTMAKKLDEYEAKELKNELQDSQILSR